MPFNGHVVWITGASSGIGRALALEFARRGADLALSARREEKLRDVAGEIEALGHDALVVPCDVTEEAQVEAAVQQIVDHFGHLDVAVANAGFGVMGTIEDVDAETWRRQLDVNVVGLTQTARYAIPELRKTSGRVVLIGSVASMVTLPNTGAYSASKAAVRSIGQALSMELKDDSVTCTTIHPGLVESDIARVDNTNVHDPDRKDPRNQELMWPTDKAARVMADAIEKRKREYVFTGHGKIMGFLCRHFPGVMFPILANFSR
ncbi:short chain dehydrogenase [Longibacter salinarum]|uniref:Short chain dehydrogenase n=1 Tax=Longibacter salinarum TaxID=1850348 RepID=A0A2A8CVG6_9BACT|nr:SDR family oxidoreductase [Longibacter salinarum]PEN12584.1 short chain dehydrogenase [Longibacter salinarum]